MKFVKFRSYQNEPDAISCALVFWHLLSSRHHDECHFGIGTKPMTWYVEQHTKSIVIIKDEQGKNLVYGDMENYEKLVQMAAVPNLLYAARIVSDWFKSPGAATHRGMCQMQGLLDWAIAEAEGKVYGKIPDNR